MEAPNRRPHCRTFQLGFSVMLKRPTASFRFFFGYPYSLCIIVPLTFLLKALGHDPLQWFLQGSADAFSSDEFLGAFIKLRKATISFVMVVRLSVRMEHNDSHWTDFHEI